MSTSCDESPPGYQLLSVIVPVYNERNTVGEIMRRMRMVELPIEREIVVVDDGSVDGTDRVLGALEDSTVKVVTHAVNRGKGAAVRTGVAAARGDVVLIQDADLEYDPQDWPKLLAPLLQGRTKVVYGSRYIGEREVVSLGDGPATGPSRCLTAVLFNATLTDVETGYKAIDRKVFDSLDLTADRFDFEPEITAKLLRQPPAHLRGPDHLRRAQGRRGSQVHLAGRDGRGLDAAPAAGRLVGQGSRQEDGVTA